MLLKAILSALAMQLLVPFVIVAAVIFGLIIALTVVNIKNNVLTKERK